MASDAGDLRVRDVLDRVAPARVLGDARVGVVDSVPVLVVDHVFEHRTISERTLDLRLRLGG